MSAHGASAGRAEKCTSGDSLRSRSGSGGPSAGAQSVGQPGDPRASGESAPPRQGAPPVHFTNCRCALAASRHGPTCSGAKWPA